MKFEHSSTGNWLNAMRGLRHPMESYAKGDTMWYDDTTENELLCENQAIEVDSQNCKFLGIGPNDMDLAKRMIKAGTPNDKFLRQIFVSVDITAPLYWWKEMDTYKVGTVANSTSTMHKLASTPITIDCFETDDYEPNLIFESGTDDRGDTPWNYNIPVSDVIGNNEYEFFMGETFIGFLESLRRKYLETKDVRYWKELIRWLPESWLQTRTWTANYAVLRNIIHWRRGHKLTEWHSFIDWCKTLPYSSELLFSYQGGNET